ALLNSALSSATATSGGTTPGGSTSGAATPGPGHRARGALARLRLLGGIDGQFTFETKAGPRTIAFERGTIQSAASGDVVVRATDGTTWTWEIVSDSVIRDRGRKTAVSALSAGQLVFVGGPVVNGARDARLIVIRTSTKVAAAQ
ncbi:MAG: hypothetical protein JO242_29440, partial [Streptosporangiaceae bacterium]|nr:hypothetical protein [Streptosporangiaceae bacterium]